MLNDSRRYSSLDGLRGVAAVYVLFFHASWSNHLTNYQFFRNGYLAVDLFFLLSGFVMFIAYGQRLNDIRQAASFMVRRFFRVYPLHIVVLSVLFFYEAMKISAIYFGFQLNKPAFSGTNNTYDLMLNALFLQGTFFADDTSWNQPSWSASAEFWVYLVFAGSVIVGLFRSRVFCSIATSLAVLAYIALAVRHKTLDLTGALGLVRCVSGFTIGATVGFICREWKSSDFQESISVSQLRVLEFAACVSVITPLVFFKSGAEVVSLVGFVGLLFVLQDGRGSLSAVLSGRAAQWLGLISYSIYLIHAPILGWMRLSASRLGGDIYSAEHGATDYQNLCGDALLLTGIFVVLLVGIITFKFIEEPARKYGQRLSNRLFNEREAALNKSVVLPSAGLDHGVQMIEFDIAAVRS